MKLVRKRPNVLRVIPMHAAQGQDVAQAGVVHVKKAM
jgi:hypothetical protein